MKTLKIFAGILLVLVVIWVFVNSFFSKSVEDSFIEIPNNSAFSTELQKDNYIIWTVNNREDGLRIHSDVKENSVIFSIDSANQKNLKSKILFSIGNKNYVSAGVLHIPNQDTYHLKTSFPDSYNAKITISNFNPTKSPFDISYILNILIILLANIVLILGVYRLYKFYKEKNQRIKEFYNEA